MTTLLIFFCYENFKCLYSLSLYLVCLLYWNLKVKIELHVHLKFIILIAVICQVVSSRISNKNTDITGMW